MNSARIEKTAAWVLAAVPVLFNLVFLFPELTIGKVSLNDQVYHLSASERMAEALTTGENPLDCWVGKYTLGYPVWRSYQPFPHFLTAVCIRLFAPFCSAKTVYLVLLYLLLSFLPLCYFALARAAGLSPLAAGVAAMLSLTVSSTGEPDRYGSSYGAALWRGSGVYTQFWALALLLLSLAAFLRALRRGKGLVLAGVLLGLTALSHIVFGYIAMLTAAVALLLEREPRLARRLLRAAVALTVALVLIAFFLIPMWQDRDWINHSRWESSWKWNSLGANEILKNLVAGKQLDGGRLPVLSLLAAAGAVMALARFRRDRTSRLVLVPCLLWLAIWFGRVTWGELLKLLALPEDMHLHRFQAGFEVFAVLLAALAVERGARALDPWQNRLHAAVALALIALVALPLYIDRAKYIRTGVGWGRTNLKAYEDERQAIEALMSRLSELEGARDGRVHAGRAGTWGRDFKVGSTPMYALLTDRGFACTSFLYHSMSPASDTMVLLNESRVEDFELFGVRYVVAPEGVNLPSEGVRLVDTFGRFRLYEVPGASYFSVVTVPYAFEENRKTMYDPSADWLNHPLRRAGQCLALYVSGPAPEGRFKKVLHRWDGLPMPDPADSPPTGRVLSEQRERETYRAIVELEAPAYVLFKTSFHPGLVARVDGKAVKTLMVAPAFLAFPVGAGTHAVDVAYRAGPLKPFLLFAGIALIAALGWAARRGAVAALEDRLDARAATASAWLGARPAGSRTARAAAWWRAHAVYLTLLLALGIVALRPTIRGLLMDGHDATEYPPRVIEFHENVSRFIVPPLWAPDLGNGHGQPLFQFLPPLYYACQELFYLAGAGLANACQLPAFFLGLWAAASMYGIGVLLGSRVAGLLMAVAYLFAPYFQTDLYVRGNFMEFAAVAVLPFATWMLLRVGEHASLSRVALAAVSIALPVLSHNATALVALPMLLVIGIAAAFPSRRALGGVALSFAAGLALTFFFWGPALFEKDFVKVDSLRESFLHYSLHFVYWRQLFYSPWGYGLSVEGPGDGMSFMVGIVHLALGVAGAVICIRRWGLTDRRGRLAAALALTAFAGVFFCTAPSKPFWDAMPILQYLQFPWRFLCVPAVALSVLAGMGFLAVEGRLRAARWLAIGAAAALVAVNIQHAEPKQYLTFDDEFYAPASIARKGMNTTTREEYEPKWVKQRPPYSPEGITPLDPVELAVAAADRRPDRQEYRVTVGAPGGAQAPVRLRLNTFYYPRWEVRIDGVAAEIAVEDVSGLILFSCPPGKHRIEARLEPTPLRRWSLRISAAAAALLTLALALGGRRRVGLARNRGVGYN